MLNIFQKKPATHYLGSRIYYGEDITLLSIVITLILINMYLAIRLSIVILFLIGNIHLLFLM